MSVLVDTNLLARSAQPGHSMYKLAIDALSKLIQHGEELCVVPWNLYEFWVVCTRPEGENGLGMNVAEAQTELARIGSFFTILSETSAIYPEWERLVARHDVKGKPAHDTHLVAAMTIHGIQTILSFNRRDFARYPGINVLTPEEVIRLPSA